MLTVCIGVHMQICLSAAMTLAALPTMVKGCLSWLVPRPALNWLARAAPKVICAALLLLSLSRSVSLVINYGAPLRLYRQLPVVQICFSCDNCK